MTYLWLKVLHLVAVISWMAGILYLPRLFIYHHGVDVGSEASETFKVMERRLAKAIMSPAMMVAWIAGLTLLFVRGVDTLTSPWMAFKLLCVILMTAIHMMLLSYMKDFAADGRPKSAKFFRFLNEGPTLLMIAIVIFVVIKPQFGV